LTQIRASEHAIQRRLTDEHDLQQLDRGCLKIEEVMDQLKAVAG
jgi:hypothetical protein